MGIIARQSIKASLAGFMGVGIGALTVLFILPKYLTPDEIGVLSTLQRASILLYSFMLLGVVFSIRKFNKSNLKSKVYNHAQFLGANFIFLLASICFFSLLYFLFHEIFIKVFITNSSQLLDFLYLPLALAIGSVFFQYFFAVAGSFSRIAIPNIFNSVVNRLLVIVAILLFAWHVLAFNQFVHLYLFFFYIIPLLLIVFYVLKILKVEFSVPTINQLKGVFNDTLRYNTYLYFTITSSIMIVSIDTLMISSMQGTSQTAVYTIAFFIATVIEIPQRMLIQVASPILSLKLEENKMDELKNIYKKSSIIQLFVGYCLFTMIWFNLDAFYQIMPNGDLYKGGVWVVLLISIAKIVDIGFGLNKQIIEMSDYFNYNLYINILLSILVVGLNLFFIPKYGITGAALASLIAITISNLLSFLLVWVKSEISPFSKNTLIILSYTTITYVLFYNFLPDISNPILSICINSLFIGISIAVLFYLIDLYKLIRELKQAK
tara:strand:- start:650 stop:2125 length:1476 start_codon:yes stop_codon:yes gene_type:complete